MKPRALLVLLMALSVGGLAATVSISRLADARSALGAAQALLLQTAREAQEIDDLRAKAQTIESRLRPAQDVIAQVNVMLAEVGIPSGHFRSLTPESDGAALGDTTSSMASNRVFKQSLRLVLEDLSPQHVGDFLVQWRSSQQIWTPTRIELMHNRAGGGGVAGRKGGKPDAGDANRYDVTILLTALYLADAPTAPSSLSPATEGS